MGTSARHVSQMSRSLAKEVLGPMLSGGWGGEVIAVKFILPRVDRGSTRLAAFKRDHGIVRGRGVQV